MQRVFLRVSGPSLFAHRQARDNDPSEVEAIDDWSFDVRIRSRSEVIRQLIRAGLEAKKGAEKPAKASKK